MKEQKGNNKRKKGYSVKRIADKQEYNKEEDGRSTSGMTKLMAISSRGGEIEDFEDCGRRSLLEFSEFSGNAAARKVHLRL